jgi:hypothetical protein
VVPTQASAKKQRKIQRYFGDSSVQFEAVLERNIPDRLDVMLLEWIAATEEMKRMDLPLGAKMP